MEGFLLEISKARTRRKNSRLEDAVKSGRTPDDSKKKKEKETEDYEKRNKALLQNYRLKINPG